MIADSTIVDADISSSAAITQSKIAGMGAWTSYAPTLSGGWANGSNGVWTAYYAQVGKTVYYRGKFVVGSNTTKGTGLTVSLPVTAATNAVTSSSVPVAFAVAGGTNTHLLFGFLNSTTTLTLYAINAAGTYIARANVTTSVPATWATNDEIHFSVTYEAA
jgi:hypothetical protein